MGRRRKIRNLQRPAPRAVRGDATEAVAGMLETLLGNEYVLYTKTRNFHWNVTGPLFAVLHEFFETQYEELDEIVDEVAERLRTLGHKAPGTMREFLDRATLGEHLEEWPDARGMISRLLSDHDALIEALNRDVEACLERHHDPSTADFMLDVQRKHETMAWMLREQLSA